MSSALKQAEELFDTLQQEERVRLLQYIAPRIMASPRVDKLTHDQTIAAWERLQQIGAEMDAQNTSGPSLIEILTEMRNA